MNNKCMNCTEKCPQAERIQNTALGRMYAKKELVPLLKKIESGELVPVVHGRWEHAEYHGFLRCSECKDVYIDDTWVADGKWNYCPNCGAKMDGGTNETD